MKPTTRLGVAAIAGGVGALAFQPFGWWPMVLPAWVGFFLAVRQTSFRWGVRAGVLFGVVLYASTLTWLWRIFGSMAPALWMILALWALIAGLRARRIPEPGATNDDQPPTTPPETTPSTA